jgi:hypothetical protein
MKIHFGDEILVLNASDINHDGGKYDMDASIKYHYAYVKQILEMSLSRSQVPSSFRLSSDE